MGVIGLKTLGKGVVSAAKNLPDATLQIIRRNESLRNLFIDAYAQWIMRVKKLNVDDLSKLTTEERKVLQMQDDFFRSMDVPDSKTMNWDDAIRGGGQAGKNITKPSLTPSAANRPTGSSTRISVSDNKTTILSINAENNAANILSKKGYHVEQNPIVLSLKNPDYRIEGEGILIVKKESVDGTYQYMELHKSAQKHIYKYQFQEKTDNAPKPEITSPIVIDKSRKLEVCGDASRETIVDKKTGTTQSRITDKANKLTDKQKENLNKKIESIKDQTGVNWKVYIVDNNTNAQEKQSIIKGMGDVKEPVIYLEYNEKGEIEGNIYGGDKMGYIPINNDFIQKLITPLRPLDGAIGMMLEGLSHLIGKAAIPEEYYNPKYSGGYNDTYAVLYSVMKGDMQQAQIEMAFVCGIWNGLIGAVQALPDGTKLVTDGVGFFADVIFDKKTARADLQKFRETDKWETFKDIAGVVYDEIDQKTTGNPPMVSYYSGRVVFDVATIYLAVAKVGKVGTVLNAMEQFNAFSQVISKVMKATGVVLKMSGKVIKVSAQSGFEFIKVLNKSGKLYCFVLAPLDGEDLSKAYKAALEKFKEKWNQGLIKAEQIIVTDANGNQLVDELGRKIGYVEENGEKIFILLDESLDNLPGRLADEMAEGGSQVSESLLQNKAFREIYEPLEKGSHIRKYEQYNVSIAEESALKLYIRDDFYSSFNKALSGEIAMTSEYSAIKNLLSSAYSKLPKLLNIKVFRGAGASESAFAKTLQKGQQFNFGGRFTSSSVDDFTADLFRRGGNGDVIWQIESKTGVDLKLINSSESEILFAPNSKFELLDIIPSDKTPNVLIYKIKEL